MRVLGAVALGVALLSTTIAAASVKELGALLPTCAVKCMAVTIPKTSCTLADQTCQCTDETYTALLQECVVSSCTTKESLTTKNVTSTACGAPVRDRTKAVSYAGVIGLVIACIAFILRIVARFKCLGGTFGMDDLTMGLTMCLVIPLSALSVVLADTGLGKDMWTLPFENVTRILYVSFPCYPSVRGKADILEHYKIYFWDELLYLSILPMTKISICCFYLRIFPARNFRSLTYIVIGLNIAYLLAFVLVSIFQCRPIQGAWLHWDGEGNYKCNHINAQGWASAIINMLLDLIVMILPLKQLYELQLSIKKKAFVMCMFSLGIFVTVVSILRLDSLINFASTDNVTWDYVTVGYWSTIECHVGVICACLPAIRSLLRTTAPKLFGDTSLNKSSGMNSTSRGTGSRLEGAFHVRSKHDDQDFLPLVDMDHSSLIELHPNPKG
ncbi:hypothetical protein CBS115988_2031 [Aspergillus niger]|nr:hypothetical protein CBS11232_10438 [Aspergillus niger]KAI2879892.1 hypothetical protein CBS115988_2031 [Aspergillus niger]